MLHEEREEGAQEEKGSDLDSYKTTSGFAIALDTAIIHSTSIQDTQSLTKSSESDGRYGSPVGR